MQQIVLLIFLFHLPNIFSAISQSPVVASDNLWDIRPVESTIDCNEYSICYQLELRSSTVDWALGDQNYRLFFDGALMTVDSVKSLLPTTHYSAAVINQNIKISGQGQEAFSPLDSIDQNLGFLDFSVTQTDRSDPTAAFQISTSAYSAVAEICLSVEPVVLQDLSLSNCLYLYHSRPETAGTITNQYTTLTENNSPNTSTSTTANSYEDFTPLTTTAACPSPACACQSTPQTISP